MPKKEKGAKRGMGSSYQPSATRNGCDIRDYLSDKRAARLRDIEIQGVIDATNWVTSSFLPSSEPSMP